VHASVTRSVVLVVFRLAGAFVGGVAGSVWGAPVANLIAIGVAPAPRPSEDMCWAASD